MCENLYDVRHNTLETNTIKELQITKTLNLHNCIGKPRVFTNVPGVRCLSEDCSVIDEVCRQRLKEIKTCLSTPWKKYLKLLIPSWQFAGPVSHLNLVQSLQSWFLSNISAPHWVGHLSGWCSNSQKENNKKRETEKKTEKQIKNNNNKKNITNRKKNQTNQENKIWTKSKTRYGCDVKQEYSQSFFLNKRNPHEDTVNK